MHKKQPLNAFKNIGENTTLKGSKHPIPHALPCTYTSQAREPREGRGFRFLAGAAASYLTLLLRLWPAPPQCSALAPHLSPCRAAARCMLLPPSLCSLGPAVLDAALLHASGSVPACAGRREGVQGIGTVQDAPQLVTRAFFCSTS